MFVTVFTAFPLFMPKSESILTLFAQSLFFKERREQIAPVTFYKRVTLSEWLPSLYKRATLSDSLRLLMTKEQRERFALFTRELLFRLKKNKQFAQKTDEQSPNPAIFLADLFLCARISWIVCMYKCYWQTSNRSKGWVGAHSVCKLGKFIKMSFAWSYTTELEDAGFEPGRAPDSTSRCATNLLPHYKLKTIVINAVGLIILRTF